MSELSFDALDFCDGCFHGAVHGRHLFLVAVAGVIRRHGVSRHRVSLVLDLLMQHGRPVLALAQTHLNAWQQWRVTIAAAAKHSMQLDIPPRRGGVHSAAAKHSPRATHLVCTCGRSICDTHRFRRRVRK